jgi:hypothetical protein
MTADHERFCKTVETKGRQSQNKTTLFPQWLTVGYVLGIPLKRLSSLGQAGTLNCDSHGHKNELYAGVYISGVSFGNPPHLQCPIKRKM